MDGRPPEMADVQLNSRKVGPRADRGRQLFDLIECDQAITELSSNKTSSTTSFSIDSAQIDANRC